MRTERFYRDGSVRSWISRLSGMIYATTWTASELISLAVVGAALLVTVFAQTSSVNAETYDNQLPGALTDMGVTEHLGESIPLDLGFRDEEGRAIRLNQYFKSGRPVILSFNYSNCPMLCSLQLTGLINGLKDVELSCGRDYEFMSISIDPHEQPLRAAQTRQRYYQAYQREGTGAGWHFLVGAEPAIAAATSAVGMTYRYLPERKEYLHPAVCVVVTPDGRLSRYLYGVEFTPQTLRLAIVEASEGKIGTTLDRILLFCFHYDSVTGRYALAARRLKTTAGAFTALILGGFLLRQFRRESQSRKSKLRSASKPSAAGIDLSLKQQQAELAADPAAILTTSDVVASNTH